jgi:hypothetical protein
LFQKLKLIERGKFNHLINILTSSSHVGSNYILIGESQQVKCLTEMKSELYVELEFVLMTCGSDTMLNYHLSQKFN